jgi:DNA-binding response OmpR family regulator
VEWRQKAEQAVRQVSELKPDLIVLDVGLPVLNGIEAAVRMLAVSQSPEFDSTRSDPSLQYRVWHYNPE